MRTYEVMAAVRDAIDASLFDDQGTNDITLRDRHTENRWVLEDICSISFDEIDRARD